MNSKGGLRLTEAARPVLKGQVDVSFRVEEKAQARKKSTASKHRGMSSEHNDMWERLRERRRQLASEQGLPAYVIFHDATLMDMAEKRPATLSAMANISGVGAAKLEKYGQIFLDEINAKQGDVHEVESPDAIRAQILKHALNGVSVDEISTKCGLEDDELHRHLAVLIRQGELVLEQINLELDSSDVDEMQSEMLSAMDRDDFSTQAFFQSLDQAYPLSLLKLIHASILVELGG